MRKGAEMKNKRIGAIIYALMAALFYAVNVPCAKFLLAESSPTFMASLLYFGAGIGVGLMYLFVSRKENPEIRLGKKDIPYTVAMVLGYCSPNSSYDGSKHRLSG